ncbi:DUF397 domain-containing protein [Streptomyces sp. CB02959]|uniref:DUF397 domain-containing protein n=1 Tax=unclassified Streptomyces TaxID=2593676 RepID=UPI000C276F45|nr:DUF397 domain-containing protein [Streptomyces sp. CB02959]PJN40627.1 DUF397 domain-containing protein [Streptomyces sp. CB02959]
MPEFTYQKSSYSDHEDECVEVATNIPHTIAIRDSKDPLGPILRLGPASWAAFNDAVAAGRFERG